MEVGLYARCFFVESSGIDADHPEAVGAAGMLHAAEEEGGHEELVGEFETVEAGVAHACGVEGVEGGVALLEQALVQLACRFKVAIHEPRISKRPVHQNIRGVSQAIFHSTDDSFFWLIDSRKSECATSHNLTIHRETLKQLARPVDIGVGFILFLIAQRQLAESLVGEAVLRNQFQQVGRLAVVATLIVTVGELRTTFLRVFHREGLLVVSQGLEGVVLLHQAVAGLNC